MALPFNPRAVHTFKAFGQLLRKCREQRALTLDALARITGISKPYLSNIETARAPGPPSPEKLAKLEAALGLSPRVLTDMADWLRTPESIRKLVKNQRFKVARRADDAINLDAMLPRGLVLSADTPHASAPVPLISIPVINKVPAGTAGEFTDLDYPAGVADTYIDAPGPQAAPDGLRGIFAVRVVGDSMTPQYVEGDIVVVTADRQPRDGDDCIIRLGEGENFATTFKQIAFEYAAGVSDGEGNNAEPSAVRLLPLNAAHAPRTVRLEEVSGMYPVLWKISPVRRVEPQPLIDQPARSRTFSRGVPEFD